VPAETTHAPVGFAHRVGAFLLRELREMLSPTIFFFIGLNLIVLTTNLLLADYGAQFGSFMLAAAAALIVGKRCWSPTRCGRSATTIARR
jgi:hypothetical protein